MKKGKDSNLLTIAPRNILIALKKKNYKCERMVPLFKVGETLGLKEIYINLI
jgi:hypothetical protein